MQSPASALIAWIGPAICQQHYQVDTRIANHFSQYEGAVEKDAEADKWRLDLPRMATMQLLDVGVTNITHAGLCTYRNNEHFFSHRRASHQKEPATGRMVSVIGII